MADQTISQVYVAHPKTVVTGASKLDYIDETGADAAALFSSLFASIVIGADKDVIFNNTGVLGVDTGVFTYDPATGELVFPWATTSNLSITRTDLGTVSSGTVTLDQSVTAKQKLTIGGNLTIAVSWASPAGVYGEIELELVNGAAHTITWPTVNWLKGDGTNSTTFSTMGVTLQTSGTNWVSLWSTDGGTTLWGSAA